MSNSMIISTREKISFGLGDFASNLSWQTTMMFLAFYFTDIYGISAAAVGTIFLVSRMVDALTDPVLGYITDRTKTRWGSYRPYILFMAIPFGIMSYIPYSAPTFADNHKEMFALFSYLILIIGFTAINIPYSSLGNVITSDNKSRVSMQGYRFSMTAAAGLLISLSVAPLAAYLGGDDVVKGYRGAMLVMGGIATVFFLICFMGVKERIKVSPDKELNIKSAIKSIFNNKPLLLLTVTMLLTNMMGAVKFGGAMYYVKHYLNQESMAYMFLGAMMLGGVFGALCAGKANQYLNKCHLYASCCFLQGIACLSVTFWSIDSSIYLFILSQFAFGFFFQMMLVPQFSLISDYVDEHSKKTGERYDGLAVSGCIFVMKTGGAIGGAIMGWILAMSGYNGTGENTDIAINTIGMLYGFYPTLLLFILTAVIYFLLPDFKGKAEKDGSLSSVTSN